MKCDPRAGEAGSRAGMFTVVTWGVYYTFTNCMFNNKHDIS